MARMSRHPFQLGVGDTVTPYLPIKGDGTKAHPVVPQCLNPKETTSFHYRNLHIAFILVEYCSLFREKKTKSLMWALPSSLHVYYSRCKIKNRKGKPMLCSSPMTPQGNSNQTEHTLSLPPTFSTTPTPAQGEGTSQLGRIIFLLLSVSIFFFISFLTCQFPKTSMAT